ncbi:MAG TPA: sigma-70 family RNA polymerase sigma factor [Povalibacter sp.]|jgi:RNA polymerase sigma-70 factor (ECF subfamily)|nr:sigma-70 family RNA polymerase sigma factor [Povalibacter sp.]
MSQPSDRSTDSNAAAAGRRRFEALCLPYRADVYRFLFWLCRNRALTDDVMQETLLRAWRSIDSLSDEKAARPWLLTIARRELARTFERKRLETVDLDEVAELPELGHSQGQSAEVDEMRRAIFQLEPTYREPLVLQVLFGYSTEEIATQLEISVPAVLTRLFRARNLLRRKMLGQHNGEGVGQSVDESDDDELS